MKTTFLVSFSLAFQSYQNGLQRLPFIENSRGVVSSWKNWLLKLSWAIFPTFQRVLVKYNRNWWLELSWKGCVKARQVDQQITAIMHIFNWYCLDVGSRNSSCVKHKSCSSLTLLFNASRIIQFGALWTEIWSKYL